MSKDYQSYIQELDELIAAKRTARDIHSAELKEIERSLEQTRMERKRAINAHQGAGITYEVYADQVEFLNWQDSVQTLAGAKQKASALSQSVENGTIYIFKMRDEDDWRFEYEEDKPIYKKQPIAVFVNGFEFTPVETQEHGQNEP